MNAILSILLVFLSSFAAAHPCDRTPEIHFENLSPHIHSVYYGEKAVISFKFAFKYLKHHQLWAIPANVSLKIHTPLTCPPFVNRKVNVDISAGLCLFDMIIHGHQLGQVTNGSWLYYVNGHNSKGCVWDLFPNLHFSVSVIPHPLSMANIPVQQATANLPVNLNLKPYVNYFRENAEANARPVVNLSPANLDGLYYDPASFAVVGSPTRMGSYQFKVSAQNIYGKTMETTLYFEVGANVRDKPEFKTDLTIASAIPGQNYELNLTEFIKPKISFKENNPLRFRIDQNEPHPDWLTIGGNDNNLLIGQVPVNEAGTTQALTLIASSNTGGDSKPLKLAIPITTDPANRPSIASFSFEKPAGIEFEYDLGKHLTDPAQDDSLRVIIDKIEPAAPWLQRSATNPRALFGTVPEDAAGQVYQLSLHATTRIGGDSEQIKAKLRIALDKELRPRFKSMNPELPMAYPGTSLLHDFVANDDIFPDYEKVPYQIELARGYDNPSWLRIENNKLIADLVPEDLGENVYTIYLTIKNRPGGRSEVISLMLFAMI